MRLFAKFISFIFHPVLFLSLAPFLIIYKETESSFYAAKWGIFTSTFILLGVFVFLIGRWRGIFSDFDITKREERGKFYGVAVLLSLLYFAIAVSFKGFLFPLSIVAIAIFFGVIIFDIVNRYIKASIHIAVVCSFVLGASILFGNSVFLITIWMIPLLAWSRIILKRHTPMEVFVGGTLGALITLFTALIGQYIL